MKVRFQRRRFEQALRVLKPHVKQGGKIVPHVFGARVIADEGAKPALYVTDLETDITITVEGTVEEAGQADGLDVVKALQLLKGKGPEDVVVRSYLAGEVPVLTAEVFAGDPCPCRVAETELPERNLPDATRSFSVNGAALLLAIDRVAYAVSDDTTRVHLNGVALSATSEEGNIPTFITSDGHRLATAQISDEEHDFKTVILPRPALTAVRALIKYAASGGESIEVTFHEADPARRLFGDFVSFRSNGWSVTTRLIDGEFPPYKQVIPRTFQAQATVSASELRDVLTRTVARLDADKQGRSRPLELRLHDHAIDFLVPGAEAGGLPRVVVGAVTARLLEGSGSVGFNAGYLLDVLKSDRFFGDIELRFSGLESEASNTIGPAVFVDPANDTHQHVVMPMRL